MKILVVGMGIVGTATARGFFRLGHDVVCYDISDVRRRELEEEGYKVSESPVDADVIFVCTPEEAVEEVVKRIVEKDVKGLIVIRSTVPPGTTTSLFIKHDYSRHICHNPEFLREAVADYEFMNPYRIVIGDCCKKHGDLLEELYKPFNVPIVRTDPTTSEMIKLASNAYLATQISFWNQMYLICEKLGVNSHVVGKVCALDPRISQYGASLHGQAYSGRCLPKDVAQLNTLARKLGVTTVLLEALKEINNFMRVVEK